jgi:glycine hydroxymethyltransferase
LILCKSQLAQIIDKAVFPGEQGGPLENIIAAKAVCFFEAMQPSFKKYQHQIILNARAMAQEFIKQGIRLVSGGTDNHLMVLDVSALNLDSKKAQDELEELGIYVNRNAIPNDSRPPYNPSGIRLGTPAITSRGFGEKEAVMAANLVAQVIKNINNQKIKLSVKAEAQRLVKKFPVYAGL